MSTYKISGPRSVAGKNPGEIVNEADLDGCNVQALIEGGHLVPATTTKAAKAATTEE